jgi:hypothetical protein
MMEQSMRIAESDWKKFKRVRTLTPERLSQRVLDDCGHIRGEESVTAYERYLELYRLFQNRDREMANTFNDLRRSTASLCLMQMWRRGRVTDGEMAAFSPEAQRPARLEP